MARSIWKGPFVELSLLKKAEAAQDSGGRAPIKVRSRPEVPVPATDLEGLPDRPADLPRLRARRRLRLGRDAALAVAAAVAALIPLLRRHWHR